MRKLILAALLAAAPACKHAEVPHVETIEEAPHLVSVVHMNDRGMTNQLVRGFYEIESDAWRWTMQNFAVNLRPPAHAARTGAVLELQFHIPDSSFKKLGPITLSATVAGSGLAPETYSKPGEYTYQRDVPTDALSGDAVLVEFRLDKAIPPGDVDKRELGVVTSSVGLVAK
jgi:hypothetical protein